MSHEQAKSHRRFLLLIVIAGFTLGVLLLLTSCKYTGTELAFETIEQKSGAGSAYSAVEPGLWVISGKEDIANLQAGSDEAIYRLQEIDYEDFFALIVYQGQRGSGGYDVQIERVTRDGKTINIYAQFHKPKPDEARIDLFTSPYHLVQVEKTGEWDQEFLFQVIVDGMVVVSIDHFIP
jgi:hypothetical protein